jgi:hypothetical protein
MTIKKGRAALAGARTAGSGMPFTPSVYAGFSPLSTPIFAGRQVIGLVEGDTFRKNVRASVHQLRRPRAWAFDVDSLDQAERCGAKFAEIHDCETGRTWRASIATIRARGFRLSRGFGEQVGLLLDDFGKDDAPGFQLALAFVA